VKKRTILADAVLHDEGMAAAKMTRKSEMGDKYTKSQKKIQTLALERLSGQKCPKSRSNARVLLFTYSKNVFSFFLTATFFNVT
jgi:hypothetical protein